MCGILQYLVVKAIPMKDMDTELQIMQKGCPRFKGHPFCIYLILMIIEVLFLTQDPIDHETIKIKAIIIKLC